MVVFPFLRGVVLDYMCFVSDRVTPTEIQDTSFNVKGLVEGKEYEFRVAAVNDAGPGQFSEVSEGIKPAPPPCKYRRSCHLISRNDF